MSSLVISSNLKKGNYMCVFKKELKLVESCENSRKEILEMIERSRCVIKELKYEKYEVG